MIIKIIEALSKDELEQVLNEGKIKSYVEVIGQENMLEYYVITGEIANNEDEAREYIKNFHYLQP